MIGDQRHVLGQVLDLLRAGTADALLVAGDVYDKSQPSSEAVALVDWFLQGVADTGVPAIVIPGNHDSAERVAYAGGLLSRQGIHMAPAFDGRIEPVMLADEHGPVAVWPIPFLHPAQIRHFLPDAKADTYTDAFRALVASLPLDASVRNVAVAHQFVTAAGVTVERSDSEVSVGGLDNVDAGVFDPFDYVALGHIHRAQRVGRDCVRYAGSLLKYSLSEADYDKSASLVTLGPKGEGLGIELVPLTPPHDLRRIRGPLAKLVSADVVSAADATVITIIAAVIGELNEAAQIHVFAVILLADPAGRRIEDGLLLGTHGLRDVRTDLHLTGARTLMCLRKDCKEFFQFRIRESSLPLQSIDQCLYFHRIRTHSHASSFSTICVLLPRIPFMWAIAVP